MQVVKKAVGDSIFRRRKHEVSQLLEVQFRVSGVWGRDACGSFCQDYHWTCQNHYRPTNITDLVNPSGAYCRGPHAKYLPDAGSPMASQAFFNGSLLGVITCISTPSSLSVPRSSLTQLVPTFLSNSLHSMVSRNGLLSRHRFSKRGMRTSAVAEPDFPEKKDEIQSQSMFPASRCGEGIAVSKTTVNATTNATSILPESRIIHETAVVHPDAFIGEGVFISAFCTVGPGVSIGNGCKLHPSSHVCGNTELGEGCEIMNGAVVGSDLPGRTVIGDHNTIGYHAVVGVKAQDLKYKEGDECFLHIGNNNDIREYVSIHRSSKPNDCTVIGDSNLFMATAHVAHDCKLGNHNIFANGTLIGGHVILGDYVHTGGAVGIHQFCHVDSYSFLAAGAMVTGDVPMYTMVSGNRAELRGLNLVGMRRLGFSDLEVKSIRRVYQKLFMNMDAGAGGLEDRLADLEGNEDLVKVPAAVALLRSVRNCFGENRRGMCTYRQWNDEN